MSAVRQTVLRMEVRHRFGRGVCPVCGCTLTPPVAQHQPPTMRTKAHDRSRGSRTPGAFLYWVHACKRCNNTQARRSFAEWAADAAATHDPHAARIAALAEIFRVYAIDNSNRV